MSATVRIRSRSRRPAPRPRATSAAPPSGAPAAAGALEDLHRRGDPRRLLGLLRDLRLADRARRPVRGQPPGQARRAVRRALVRHRPTRPRRLLARDRRRAQIMLVVAPLATVLGTVLGTTLGLVTGYFRGAVDDVMMRFIDAFLALPRAHHRAAGARRARPLEHRRSSSSSGSCSHRSSLAPCAPRCSPSASSTTSPPRGCATSAPPTSCSREILPNVHGAGDGRVHRAARLRDLRHRHALVSRLRHPAAGARLGAPDLRALRADLAAAIWWPVLFPALAIATLVIGVNLVADGVHAGVRAMSARRHRLHQPALELTELEVAYRVRGIERQVLRGVSFTIGEGESYGLVGESGCGKSTAAFAIMRYLPRNGQVIERLDLARRPRPHDRWTADVRTMRTAAFRWSTRTRARRSTRRSGSATRSPRSS